MASLATAEACDTNAALLASSDLRVCRAFSGPVVTLKVSEDNVKFG